MGYKHETSLTLVSNLEKVYSSLGKSISLYRRPAIHTEEGSSRRKQHIDASVSEQIM